MKQVSIRSTKSDNIEKAIEYLTYIMILMFYTGKVFQVFTIVIDILFIILLYMRKEKVFLEQHKELIISFLVLFLYFAVQSLFSTNIKVALINSLGMVRFVILFFALWYVFNTQEKIKKLIYSVFIIIAILFLDASYQYITGKDIFGYPLYNGFRLTCWSHMPRLSESVAIFTGVIVASFLILKNKWIPWLLILFLVLMMFLSGNKGPVVYLIGAVIVVLLFSSYRKYLLPMLLGLGVMVVIVLATNEKIYERFSAFENPMSSENTTGRTLIYKTAIEMIKDNPLLGIGSKNFRYDFPKYYPEIYNAQENKGYFDELYLKTTMLHTHSLLLSFLLNWGTLGSLMFLYILYQIYKKHIRHNEVALLTSIGLLYSIAPFNFGKSIAQGQWQFYVFLALAFVVVLGSYKQLQEENKH